MALPDFKKLEQNKTVVPAWAKYLKDDEFISYENTYKSKIYFHLFDRYEYPCAETGAIRYYVYDPVKHGADPTKKYPVLMALSRKTVIGALTGREVEDRLAGTLAADLLAVQSGAFMVRVHDVKETVDSLKVLKGISEAR